MRLGIGQIVRRLSLDCYGGTAMIYAMALPPLILMAGMAVDLGRIEGQKRTLQTHVDAAAIHAAREFILAGSDAQSIEAAANAYVQGVANDQSIRASVNADPELRSVEVTLIANTKWFFPQPSRRMSTLTVSATAQLSGQSGNLCMVGLNQTAENTLHLNTDARLTAPNCAIYTNSGHTKAFAIKDGARISADLVCVTGGISGDVTKVVGEVVTDCPSIEDPLAQRAIPFSNDNDVQVNFLTLHNLSTDDIADAGCDHTSLVVRPGETTTLDPGVYCGGIAVIGGDVSLNPGEYIIKDGLLTVAFGGTLEGENVGFFLTGSRSTMAFTGNSTIDLTAPKQGVLSGMLFFEDPTAPTATYHTISSNDARRLVGTIYIPQSKLLIAGNDPIADESEYTIIVANQFELRDGPNLVLNTDYQLSDIPVPQGVGPSADAEVYLVK